MPAMADVPYFEGFENPSSVSDSTALTTWSAATRVTSGTNSITSYAGSAHGILYASSDVAGGSGPGWGSPEPPPPNFTDSGNRMANDDADNYGWDYTPFKPTGFSLAAYLDTDWIGTGFGMSLYQFGMKGPGTLDQVYGFELGESAVSPGSFFIVGDHDPGSFPAWEGQGGGANVYRNDQTGWYVFEWHLFDEAGYTAAHLYITDPAGTRTQLSDRNSATDYVIGGGWTPAEMGPQATMALLALTGVHTIPVDNTQSWIIPEPATLALLALGSLVLLRRRR
jgi:hypothetical protein